MVSFEPRVQKHRDALFSSAQGQAQGQVLPAPALTRFTCRAAGYGRHDIQTVPSGYGTVA